MDDPEYRIYDRDSVETNDEDERYVTVKEYGCSGQDHLLYTFKIYLDKEPTDDFEELPFQHLGECDKSCGSRCMGYFWYPVGDENE